MHTFQTPSPVRLRVEVPKGRVVVIAEDTQTTGVDLVAVRGDATAQQMIAEAEVAQHGDEIVVRLPQRGLGFLGIGGAVEATVRLPLSSSAKLTTGSASIETSGRLGDVDATSGSGAITLAETAQVRARTGSGDITIAVAEGSIEAKTGSGDVDIGAAAGDTRVTTASGSAEIAEFAGAARVTTASGSVGIGRAGDNLDAFSASGDIAVRRTDHGRVSARTVSGRVCVGVADGAAAWLDINTVSGRVRSTLSETPPPSEGDKSVQVVVNTVSGAVNIDRA